ncbi:hypothetical protein LSTR_LSTR012912 [Laodelphax striatellus]|uniref:Uncharacterized protein n=1 Tax=Laodelphax striatellus TaxID=195883 RepID=A0A482X6W1_LAOST|nr:hypothetical protein LSTR_LSTR012912 [Laodelphax striatellus]
MWVEQRRIQCRGWEGWRGWPPHVGAKQGESFQGIVGGWGGERIAFIRSRRIIQGRENGEREDAWWGPGTQDALSNSSQAEVPDEICSGFHKSWPCLDGGGGGKPNLEAAAGMPSTYRLQQKNGRFITAARDRPVKHPSPI